MKLVKDDLWVNPDAVTHIKKKNSEFLEGFSIYLVSRTEIFVPIEDAYYENIQAIIHNDS